MNPRIQWVGIVYEHLYGIYFDGRTFRLDKFVNSAGETTRREWTEIARLPE